MLTWEYGGSGRADRVRTDVSLNSCGQARDQQIQFPKERIGLDEKVKKSRERNDTCVVASGLLLKGVLSRRS